MPILRGIATLHEIETYWTLEDVFLANQALDVQNEAEDWARKHAEDK